MKTGPLSRGSVSPLGAPGKPGAPSIWTVRPDPRGLVYAADMRLRGTRLAFGALGAAALGLVAMLPFACSSRGTVPAGQRAANEPGKFVWHDLTTSDPESARKFYSSLLGWKYVETTVLGHPYSVARLGEKPIGGIHAPRPENAGRTASHWLSYMSVADVDASVAKAKSEGAAVLAGPLDVGSTARAAVLRDPQGAPFGLVRLAAGDPPDPASPADGAFFWNEYLTHDLEAALAFYRGIVPFEVADQKTQGDAAYVVLRHGRARAGVFRIPDVDKDVNPNWLPYVRVADPAALAARVPGLGGRVLLQPRPDLRMGTLAVVADPTGAVIALQKYPY
jgi:predicted enzyme related to lactoylglutathione lyase